MRGKGSYLRGREEPSQREGGTFSTGRGANFLSLQIFVNSRDADSSIYDRLKKNSESPLPLSFIHRPFNKGVS